MGLVVNGLSKRFGSIVTAQNIQLTMEQGVVTALVGANGAGKTTLFNMISGQITPDAGDVQLDGRVLRGPARTRARRGLGRSWQRPRVFATLTVKENLLMASDECRWDSPLSWLRSRASLDPMPRKVSEIVERLHLTEHLETPAGQLPFGLQKLVDIARARLVGVRCLLLDEPFAGVDGLQHPTLRQLVNQAKNEDIVICLVEHNMSVVEDIADRVMFLHQGSIVADGTYADIRRRQDLAEMYFGVAQ